ncbi:MAG TPA: tryptophan synthase subunit beta, partial [Acidimicrobiales bacterium]|nr:tryptophan synthase subunit beta [Acidimicrobiales bacterium]
MTSRPVMGEPSAQGRFGEFGGRYVPESLVAACAELVEHFTAAWSDPAFHRELDDILASYGGRPTPVTECRRLSERLGI